MNPNRAAMVVGGGLAGMQASLLLASMGTQVYLVEKAPAIGGHQPLLDKTFPTDSCGLCFMSPRPAAHCPFVECERDERITVLTRTEVLGLEGEAGSFSARVRQRARGVDPEKCNGCGRCAEACPIAAPSEFGEGLEQRKAIYRPYVQAVPDAYVVDWESCDRCGACPKACPFGAVDLAEQDRELELKIGAIVVATGLKTLDPTLETEYGYGLFPNVVTGVQIERMLSRGGPTGGAIIRPSDGAPARKIAFIQCVGSRDPAAGRGYCSSVCCMYSAKQVRLLEERVPEASVVVFQMDARGVGKGYERYLEATRTVPSVEYRRSAVGAVKQVPATKDLLVLHVGGDGVQRQDRFDLVVLSLGLAPSDGVGELAERLGLAVNRHGFLESDAAQPGRTRVPGVFVAGGSREPMDVADAVAEGAAAAMSAAAVLGVGLGWPEEAAASTPGAGETPALPASALPAGAPPSVGVLLCNCGGGVGDRIDLAGLADRASSWPGVGHVAVVDDLCRGAAVGEFAGLRDHSANRVVVAACARGRVEEPLALAAAEAGFDTALLEPVNLREQCAWVHAGDERAAAKAEALVHMAVEKARLAAPAPRRRFALPPTALVIGGGPAGLTAATELAGQGAEVWVVEREADAGGLGAAGARASQVMLSTAKHLLVGQAQPYCGRGDPSASPQDDRMGAPFHLLSGGEVVRVNGHLGAFRTTVRTGNQEQQIEHSVVVVATGVEDASPNGGLPVQHPAVLTQAQFEASLAGDEAWARAHRRVAMLLCAGAPQTARTYCSRTCCAEAVASAMRLKSLSPDVEVYVLYREMRTYGFAEEQYEAARRAGVVFLRYESHGRPSVVPAGEKLAITVREPRLGRDVELEVDALVLSTGVQPRPNQDLARMLGINLDEDGFFVEANVKSRSTESRRPGVFLAGACQSPRSLADSLLHAKAAAARALSLLRQGGIETPPTVATVNERICSGCGLCVAVCAYGARELDDDRGVSKVVDILCQGCGACAAACPNGATQQGGFAGRQMVAVLDAALS